MYRRWKNSREEIKVINKSLMNNKEGIAMMVIVWLALILMPMLYKNWLGSVCYMDVFAMYSMEKKLVIIPFATLAMMFFIKNDFNQNSVIRHKSIRKVWLSTVKKLSLISFYFSILTVSMAGICGKFMADCDFNWHKPFTYFWMTTERQTVDSVSYPMVVLILFTSIFFSVLICGLVYFLIYWLTGVHIFGVLAVMTICVFNSSESIFHKLISADTIIWLHDVNWSGQILLPLGICILIIGAGCLLVKNKQFGIERDIKWMKLIKKQAQ